MQHEPPRTPWGAGRPRGSGGGHGGRSGHSGHGEHGEPGEPGGLNAHTVVACIPHALSLCGLTCGFLALIASSSGDFITAAKFIVIAIFFDGFDGAAARALHVDGPFGEMMDSLADLAVFGVAPAFLTYQSSLRFFGTTNMPGIAGALAAAMFAGCGAIRLARFPLVKNKRYFVGLPIPMAGAFLAMLGVYAPEIPSSLQVIVPALTIGVALLMVSTIQFPKFSTAFGPLPAFARWALCLSAAPVLLVWQPKAILILLAVYLALGPAGEVRTALDRDQHDRYGR